MIRAVVAEAVGTIARHRLRSSLAAVAVAAAVATTAVVLTTLDALAQNARETSARAFGSDTFVITRVAGGTLNRRELEEKLARNPVIRRTDLRFLQRFGEDRVRYAPAAQTVADVAHESRRFEDANVTGTEEALRDIRSLEIDAGRFFTAEEDVKGAQVVVLGRAVADALFPVTDPVGQSVRIARRRFTVVGLQARQGSAGGVSLDRYVWIPMAAFERAFGSSPTLQLFAKGTPPGSTSAAEDQARTTMRARRKLGPGTAENFDLVAPDAGRTFVAAITERIGAAGIPISIMALVAAVVVVANTSLVSVAQRRHEIGIRRAVGASRRMIVAETLVETGLVALAGGAAGLGLGVVVLSAASPAAGLALTLRGSTVMVGLTAAIAAGLVAGWYPARRAASVEIVTGLRAE